MPVKKGDVIKVEYTGTLDDGTVFDSSEQHGEPLEFEVGCGKLIGGFEDGVIGMEVNDEKEVRLEPDDAYGDRKETLVKSVPRGQIPKNQELEEGMMLMLTLPDNNQIAATVAALDDQSITLDLNHPLAGKTLIFKIKLIEIKK
jgi:FKBP-type peptidyl-prolyl cis-trans isomerase 2